MLSPRDQRGLDANIFGLCLVASGLGFGLVLVLMQSVLVLTKVVLVASLSVMESTSLT